MTRSTTLIHHPYRPPTAFDAPQPGVFKASSVFFPDVETLRTREWMDKSGYTYGLHGTPTTFLLEARLATLEGGTHCLLTPSGLSAIAHVDLALLQTGDAVLIPDNAYSPNKQVAEGELARFGITHQVYDPLNLADLAVRITPQTRLVWLEAAGSVTMEFPDLVAQVALCREHGVRCALDNTWGAGLAFNAFDLTPGRGEMGVDLTIHALTKYPSGGGDVLMGSIVTRDDALARQLQLSHMRLGTGIGANDAEAVLRGLPTLALRYRQQDASARELATWLQTRPEVAQVLHPALPDSPGHAHWHALCVSPSRPQGAAAGLFSIVLHDRYSQAHVDAFCNALTLFKIGYSWGGPMSLVVPYGLRTLRALAQPHLASGRLVRLCIGLEETADLQQDLARALAALSQS